MARLQKFLAALAPDISNVVRRFPVVIFFSGLFTVVSIAIGREWLTFRDDDILNLLLGLGSATIFALAGQLFSERHRASGLNNIVMRFFVPIATLAICFIEQKEWFVPELLPIVGIFWLSVSGYTFATDSDKGNIQSQFWWFNHRAITTGIVSLVGLVILSLGFLAIEQSIDLLFGLNLETIFFEFLLPLIWLFLGPIYWMSTLPELDEFTQGELDQPDFLSKAVGFLGQFILTPLLIVYSLILLAYTVQILFAQALPVGVLGWMVLLFVIAGAVNWLVLYPPFMNRSMFVRLFKKFWFWLTLIPLALFAFGVSERVSAYGLTEERYLLVAGGIWALIATLAFLSKRFSDIRLFPALAGLTFLFLSVGPWNVLNLPIQTQLWRVQALLDDAQQDGSKEVIWSEEGAREILAALNFLDDSDIGIRLVDEELASRGFETGSTAWRNGLDVAPTSVSSREITQRRFEYDTVPVSIFGNSEFFGSFIVDDRDEGFVYLTEMKFVGERNDQKLVIARDGQTLVELDVSDLVQSLMKDQEANAARIEFELDGTDMLLLMTEVSYWLEGVQFLEFNRIEFVAFGTSDPN